MKQDNSVILSEKYVIDLTKPWHVAWWAKQFGISEKSLGEAVAMAGDSPNAVRLCLSEQNGAHASAA